MFLDLPIWLSTLLAALTAAILSFLLTPPVKKLAERVGAIDMPGDKRRVHSLPVPRMGGLAIFSSFVVSVVLFAGISEPIMGLLTGATRVAFMGAIDDIAGLRPITKFLVQIVAAFIAYRCGAVVDVLSNPVFFSDKTFFNIEMISLPVTLIWIVGCTNAVNLIDGLDGLAAGVSAISSAAMFFVAMSVAESDPVTALMFAALTGACLGFIPYNTNPARIFMGDMGAQVLGYLLGVISIIGMFKLHAIVTFIIPVLALAVPLADTAFAFFRRILKGQSPFKADRGHIHHLLLDTGMNQKQVVFALYGFSAALGVCAVIMANCHRPGKIITLAVALAISVTAVVFLVISKRKNGKDGEKK